MSALALVTSVFEIVVITIVVNYLLSFFWNTRSMDLLIGAVAFLIIFAITPILHLPILHAIMTHLASVAAIAALVIFQPELRVALSKLSLKGKRYKEITEFDRFLDLLTNSIYRLAEKRMGALIVLENEDRLDEFARKGVLIGADFSSELLETIFTESTPLHDGAVIIRDMKIIAATVILPLAEESAQLTKSMGTRHRAALGVSQTTDAVVIAVSEETSKVSLARDGIMTRGVKPDRFQGIIRSIYAPPQTLSTQGKFSLKSWLRA